MLALRRDGRADTILWGWNAKDLLAEILALTRSILRDAAEKYSALSSMPMYLRPVRRPAAQELPLPAKGSSTTSPGSEKLRTSGTNAATGFCVGWSLLPL
jgi:hypothetical protein